MDVFRIKQINPVLLDAERQRVTALIQSSGAPGCVVEVGSTAIPGLLGKQDLDFLVLVTDKEFLDARAKLDSCFSRNASQMSNHHYQGYSVKSSMDVAIQLTIKGGPYDTFLAFLDRLRGSSSLRAEYNQLKLSFDGRSMEKYREAKQAFIERVLSSNKSQ